MAFIKGHIPWNTGKKRPDMIGNTFGFKKGQKSYKAMLGKKHTEEWKQMMSERMTGRKVSEQTKIKLSINYSHFIQIMVKLQ